LRSLASLYHAGNIAKLANRHKIKFPSVNPRLLTAAAGRFENYLRTETFWLDI
jgi:hypothetical protein